MWKADREIIDQKQAKHLHKGHNPSLFFGKIKKFMQG